MLIHDRHFSRQFKDISDKYILNRRANFTDDSDSYYGHLINSLIQHATKQNFEEALGISNSKC